MIALLLFLSHILTDFYLQPTSWVNQKETLKHKAWQLYVHSIIAGLLAYLAVLISYDSKLWVVAAVAIPHFLIDLWKLNQPKRFSYFIIDQLGHLTNLAIVYLVINLNEQKIMIETIQNSLPDALIILVSVLLLWNPTGIVIGKLTKKYRDEIAENDLGQSLENAGKLIGMLERTFIIIFMLIGQFQAIGFLIAAKSILRFSDHKKVTNPIQLSEYVIIGTLMSFLFAVVVGLICNYLITIF